MDKRNNDIEYSPKDLMCGKLLKKLFGNALFTVEEVEEAKLAFREVVLTGKFIPKKSGQPKSSKKRKKL